MSEENKYILQVKDLHTSFATVSYTHLDVYKRQDYMRV